MRRLLLAALAPIVMLIARAQAHFPFIVADEGGATARIVMSETMAPDPDVSIDILKGATFALRDHDGRNVSLSIEKEEHWLTIALPGSGTRIVTGRADLGVMQRGAGPAHVLLYHPKTIIGDPFDPSTVLGATAPVELVPVRADDGFRIKLLIAGAPAKSRELRVITADGTERDFTTDAAGLTAVLDEPGRYAAWARHWIDETEQREGKEYQQTRHYATLVFDYQTDQAGGTVSRVSSVVTRTPLPEPVASFGAVACDGWLYLYGGHIAERHEYSTASVSGRFRRLNLQEADNWEELAGGTPVQGMNIAAHSGKIYRVGGMQPRNAPGQPADSYSIADVACFDPSTGAWNALPPLPRPRSSHDVIVVGDRLFVIGGWWMKGRETDAEFLDTIDILDLSASELRWHSIPQPFQRRALIVAAIGDHLFAMGGFDSEEQAHLDVDIYDVSDATWTKGPAIPGKRRNGFSPAACAHDGTIYLSVSTGEMFHLSSDQTKWEPFANTTPRIVHRLIPSGSEILVVGGASDSEMVNLVEAVAVR